MEHKPYVLTYTAMRHLLTCVSFSAIRLKMVASVFRAVTSSGAGSPKALLDGASLAEAAAAAGCEAEAEGRTAAWEDGGGGEMAAERGAGAFVPPGWGPAGGGDALGTAVDGGGGALVLIGLRGTFVLAVGAGAAAVPGRAAGC
jgi:hypothetical protein